MIPSKIKIKILALRRIFAALGTKGLSNNKDVNKISYANTCFVLILLAVHYFL